MGNISEDYVTYIFLNADQDRDGVIDFEEYMTFKKGMTMKKAQTESK